MVTAYIIKGYGEGCHAEVAHAYERAGAQAEVVHLSQLLSGERRLDDAQILNLSGGFLHGDMLGAGMCGANEIEHAVTWEKTFKEVLLEFAERGVIYGQCNGFQLLVRTGLLPGIDEDYSRQSVTLTHNECGNYRVDFVQHITEESHFAFAGLELFPLWCRHGEGKLQFYTPHGSIPREQAEVTRERVNKNHVLLRYADSSGKQTEEFPHNPNGSVDGIAGLVNSTGHIFGHMGHTEVSVHPSRDPRWFAEKDKMRREGVPLHDRVNATPVGLRVFRNIVRYFD